MMALKHPLLLLYLTSNLSTVGLYEGEAQYVLVYHGERARQISVIAVNN
jgi:hypothetical protein